MLNSQFFETFVFRRFSLKKNHTADFTKNGIERNYFGLLLKGSCEIKSHKKVLFLKEGDIFFIPKRSRYTSHWSGDKNGDIEWLSFGFEVLPTETELCCSLQKIENADSKNLLLIGKNTTVSPKTVGLFYEFIGDTLGKMQSDTQSRNELLEKATAIIYGNPQLKMSEVAKKCRISESKLYGLFSEYSDTTPNKVRTAAICENVIEMLLTTDKSVEQICGDAGISSPSYLRKILKDYCGQTPLKIRKSRSGIQ